MLSSSAEAAVSFARDVYRELLRPSLPDGWDIFLDCPSSLQNDGYFGAAYIQEWKNTSYVYIAHRGTSNIPDAIEDFEMWALSITPKQFYTGAVPFIQLVFERLNEKYAGSDQRIRILFTGHSLGATLAELSILKYIHYFDDPSSNTYDENRYIDEVYIFENPGSEPLALNMLNSGETTQANMEDAANKISIYNSEVDLINTCMRSLSAMFPSSAKRTLTFAAGYKYSSLSPPKEPLPFVPDAKYFLWNYTIRDQHKIDYVYQWVFIKGYIGSYCKVGNWPVGIDNGYTQDLSKC